MKKITLIILSLCFCFSLKAQNEIEIYEKAFQKINCMLNGTCSLNFKEAVFIVENAY
jgi:hypothetical protein